MFRSYCTPCSRPLTQYLEHLVRNHHLPVFDNIHQDLHMELHFQIWCGPSPPAPTVYEATALLPSSTCSCSWTRPNGPPAISYLLLPWTRQRLPCPPPLAPAVAEAQRIPRPPSPAPGSTAPLHHFLAYSKRDQTQTQTGECKTVQMNSRESSTICSTLQNIPTKVPGRLQHHLLSACSP